MNALTTEYAVLALLLRFAAGSTLILGGVWLAERFDLFKRADIAETAWKLAVTASLCLLLPVPAPSVLRVDIPAPATTATRTPVTRNIPRILTPNQYGPDEMAPAIQAQTAAGGIENYPRPETDSEGLPKQPFVSLPGTALPTLRTVTPSTVTRLLETDLPGADIPAPGPAAEDRGSISTSWSRQAMTGVLVLIALGLAVLLLRYGLAARQLGTRQRVAVGTPPFEALHRLCADAGIRHAPYLSRSNRIGSPICLPGREICLPDWAFDDLPSHELKSLLAHELAHTVRRDPVMLIALQCLTRIFFFQPLFRLAEKRLTDLAELQADAWAARLIADPRAVAEALYACAYKINDEKQQQQWGFAMTGRKTILTDRIERLLSEDGQQNAVGRPAKALLATLMAGIAFGLPGIQIAAALPGDAAPDYAEIADTLPKPDPSAAPIVVMVPGVDSQASPPHTAPRVVLIPEVVTIPGVTPEPPLPSISLDGTKTAPEAGPLVLSSGLLGTDRAISDKRGYEVSRHLVGNMTMEDGRPVTGTINIVGDDHDDTLSVHWKGHVKLSDALDNIIGLSPGGYFELLTTGDRARRRLLVENSRDSDTLALSYYEDGTEIPIDGRTRKWITSSLITLSREAGFNAAERVDSLIRQGGTDAVLDELEKIDSDYVTRLYSQHLVDNATLTEKELKRLIGQIGKMESDYDTRLALTHLISQPSLSDSSFEDILTAAEKIESDYELRLLTSAYINRFEPSERTNALLIRIAEKIESDYELRLLLEQMIARSNMTDAQVRDILDLAGTTIESDYELRLLIGAISHKIGTSGETTRNALHAADSIESNYEKRLALSMIIAQGMLDEDGWIALVQSTQNMESDHEKGMVLQQVAGMMPRTGKMRAAFEKAVRTIDSDHTREELERVLGNGR